MMIVYAILGLLLLSCIPMAWVAARAYFKYRGTRVIVCPETKMPAAVRADGKHAGATAAIGEPDLRLESCTRWPERAGCGQECLAQIEAAPEECLVRTMLVEWYRDSSCALCAKPIGEIHWADHKPALLSPERHTVEWDDIPAEKLPEVFRTHERVCWNCHIAASFRERFPDLVTERRRAS